MEGPVKTEPAHTQGALPWKRHFFLKKKKRVTFSLITTKGALSHSPILGYAFLHILHILSSVFFSMHSVKLRQTSTACWALSIHGDTQQSHHKPAPM